MFKFFFGFIPKSLDDSDNKWHLLSATCTSLQRHSAKSIMHVYVMYQLHIYARISSFMENWSNFGMATSSVSLYTGHDNLNYIWPASVFECLELLAYTLN